MGCFTHTLGIVAPPARKRAAFEKNGGPDARAIVDGIFFYVKNFPGLHIVVAIGILFSILPRHVIGSYNVVQINHCQFYSIKLF